MKTLEVQHLMNNNINSHYLPKATTSKNSPTNGGISKLASQYMDMFDASKLNDPLLGKRLAVNLHDPIQDSVKS